MEDTITPSHKPSHTRVRMLLAAAAVTLVGGACVATALTRENDEKPKAPPTEAESEPSSSTITLPEAPAWHRARMDPTQARLAEAKRGYPPQPAANEADCLGPNPVGFGESEPVASPDELPLTDELTAEAITQACLDSYYYGQTGARADAELCVRGGLFPRPVVAIEWSCDAAGEGLRPLGGDDLARLNAMRAVEVSLMADPTDCPTADDTVAWAERILAEQELALTVHVHNEPHLDHGDSADAPLPEPTVCPLLTRVVWAEGVVIVEPFHS